MSELTEEVPLPRQRRFVRLWLALALLAAGALIVRYLHQPAHAAQRRPLYDGSAVPVQTALIKRADVPVYLEGLGTVQAYYTATMTARVDGQLQSVHFTEGQLVKKGQVLAQIDPRPYRAALDQAIANQQKDAAQLQSAQADLSRYEQLAPQNLASKQQVDDQRAMVGQLRAQGQIDRAAIDNARTQLDYTTITAPFDGRTGLRLVDPGNNVHSNDSNGIVVVTQIQPISVVFTLPEAALSAVQQAQQAGPVTVTALSQDGHTVLDEGQLVVVDNQIDAATGTVRLKATFPNPHSKLWPGQFVNARVLTAHEHGVVTLPNEAIQTGPDGPFTYVITGDSTVEVRPLKLGEQSGDVTVVREGLREGERVVTSNQFRLVPGAKVTIS